MTRLLRCEPTNRTATVNNLNREMSAKPKEVIDLAQEYVNFLNECKSPWHVCDHVRQQFQDAGFQELHMENEWSLTPGGKYYVIKGGSTILAFALGGMWTPTSRIGFVIPHSDSPALRIKPDSNRGSQDFIQVGCVLYGGGFWHTWFDRDLGIAGRVYVRNGEMIEHKLLTIWRPVACVPSLAIHFDGGMNSNLSFNFETQFLPMIGMGNVNENPDSNHQPALLKLLAEELSVSPEQILNFELNLFDLNPASIGGVNSDFVFGQFQDNQVCSFGAMKALLSAISLPEFMKANHCYMYCTYNHEEVGNRSDVGASSNWTNQVIMKICGPENFASVINRSYALSTDVNHGLHPNYSEYYEVKNRPVLDGEPSVNFNFGLSMATNASNSAIIKEIASMANVKLQKSIPINAKRMGATHGPSLSAQLGMTTCDLGPLLLAMHSIRETASTMGVWKFTNLVENFYRYISTVMDRFEENKQMLEEKNDTEMNENVNKKSGCRWTRQNGNRIKIPI